MTTYFTWFALALTAIPIGRVFVRRPVWSEVAGRYRMNAGSFYVPFNDGAGGSLSRAYAQFDQRPEGEWGSIRLEDSEIVSLVNLRVLSQELALAPSRILEARDRAGDYLTGYGDLTQGR